MQDSEYYLIFKSPVWEMLDPLLTCHNNPLSEQVCLSRGVAVKINSYDMSLFPMAQHKEMYRSEINAGNTQNLKDLLNLRESLVILVMTKQFLNLMRWVSCYLQSSPGSWSPIIINFIAWQFILGLCHPLVVAALWFSMHHFSYAGMLSDSSGS